jgi:Outer membrane protein beta-barrel domain
MNRKAFALLLVILAFAPAKARALDDPLHVTLTGGWQYGGTQPYISGLGLSAGDVHANAGANFGAMVSLPLQHHYELAVAYTYQPGELIVRPDRGASYSLGGDVAVQYLHAYVIRPYRTANPKVGVYGMTGFGVVILSGVPNRESRVVTSFGLGAGARMKLSPHMGLQLQTRLLVPVQFADAGFYFGSGGPSIGIGGGSSIIQGDTSLGLTFGFGGN